VVAEGAVSVGVKAGWAVSRKGFAGSPGVVGHVGGEKEKVVAGREKGGGLRTARSR